MCFKRVSILFVFETKTDQQPAKILAHKCILSILAEESEPFGNLFKQNYSDPTNLNYLVWPLTSKFYFEWCTHEIKIGFSENDARTKYIGSFKFLRKLWCLVDYIWCRMLFSFKIELEKCDFVVQKGMHTFIKQNQIHMCSIYEINNNMKMDWYTI